MAVTKIAAPRFRKAVENSKAVREVCLGYNEVLLLQARVTAACNILHPVESRFCRWLLQSADRAESETVSLTQDFLAEMLGVRRTSVTDVASKIQKTGAITYTRGVIKILDRGALERLSCECYRKLREDCGAEMTLVRIEPAKSDLIGRKRAMMRAWVDLVRPVGGASNRR